MIRHHHYSDLVELRDASIRSSHSDQLGSYTDALNAAVKEFEKTGSTIYDMDDATLRVERLLLEAIRQTHLHHELAPHVLDLIAEMFVDLRETDFFKEPLVKT